MEDFAMTNKKPRRVTWRMTTAIAALALLGAGSSAWIGGCSPDPADNAGDKETGSVGLDLQLAFGLTLNSVTYTITSPSGFTKVGTVNVSNSSTVSVVVGGIPFGAGYQISLRGTTLDGAAVCAGSAMFDIDSAATKTVPVHMTCDLRPVNGSIQVNGTLNTCPRIDTLDASPS